MPDGRRQVWVSLRFPPGRSQLLDGPHLGEDARRRGHSVSARERGRCYGPVYLCVLPSSVSSSSAPSTTPDTPHTSAVEPDPGSQQIDHLLPTLLDPRSNVHVACLTHWGNDLKDNPSRYQALADQGRLSIVVLSDHVGVLVEKCLEEMALQNGEAAWDKVQVMTFVPVGSSFHFPSSFFSVTVSRLAELTGARGISTDFPGRHRPSHARLKTPTPSLPLQARNPGQHSFLPPRLRIRHRFPPPSHHAGPYSVGVQVVGRPTGGQGARSYPREKCTGAV